MLAELHVRCSFAVDHRPFARSSASCVCSSASLWWRSVRSVDYVAASRQVVPSRSIVQHQISIFRATATIAFLRLVRWPWVSRSKSALTRALRRFMPHAICTSKRLSTAGPCLVAVAGPAIVPECGAPSLARILHDVRRPAADPSV